MVGDAETSRDGGHREKSSTRGPQRSKHHCSALWCFEKKSSSYEGIEAEQRYRETMKVSPPSEERRAAIDRVVAAVTAGFEVAHRDTVRAWLEAAALP